jgi:hypothetical protein
LGECFSPVDVDGRDCATDVESALFEGGVEDEGGEGGGLGERELLLEELRGMVVQG